MQHELLVRTFLADHVESLEELAVLVALGAQPGRSSSAADLPALARLPARAFDEAVASLESRRLVERVDGDSIRLVTEDPRFEALCALYQSDVLAVLKIMNAVAIERVRTGATRGFAEAFLLRGRKPDG